MAAVLWTHTIIYPYLEPSEPFQVESTLFGIKYYKKQQPRAKIDPYFLQS